MNNSKKKIAITFPQLHEFGGGEIFCEYVVNLLSKFYKIDLYFYKTIAINNKLKIKKEIKLIPVKSKNIFIDYFCRRYIGIAQLYLIFFLNLKKLNYEFLFSAAGEFYSNFYRVYQYIHHPFYSLRPSHYMALGVKKNDIIKIFLRFCLSFYARTFFYFILDKKKLDKVSLVNSKWTKKRYESIYNDKAVVVYPTFLIPPFFRGFQKNYENRKNDFVILGRVSKDKNTIIGINFFINLKNQIPNVGKLHIIGPYDQSFKQTIKSNFSNLKREIIFHGYLTIKKRNKILKNCKYGLHFAKYEHFGRAILEMHKHGMIVFVHNSGGSREIVVDHIQKYSTMNELYNNIDKTINLKNIKKKIIQKYDKKFLKNFTDIKFQKDFKNIFLTK